MLRLAKSTAESGTTDQNQRRERRQSFVNLASKPLLSVLDEIRRGFGTCLTVSRSKFDYTQARTRFGLSFALRAIQEG